MLIYFSACCLLGASLLMSERSPLLKSLVQKCPSKVLMLSRISLVQLK